MATTRTEYTITADVEDFLAKIYEVSIDKNYLE